MQLIELLVQRILDSCKYKSCMFMAGYPDSGLLPGSVSFLMPLKRREITCPHLFRGGRIPPSLLTYWERLHGPADASDSTWLIPVSLQQHQGQRKADVCEVEYLRMWRPNLSSNKQACDPRCGAATCMLRCVTSEPPTARVLQGNASFLLTRTGAGPPNRGRLVGSGAQRNIPHLVMYHARAGCRSPHGSGKRHIPQPGDWASEVSLTQFL